MGEVLAFRPRAQAMPGLRSSPIAPPTALAPARTLRDIWCDPAEWQVSRKGNLFIRIDGEKGEIA